MRDLPRVCPYLHVPAQSGCDDVLRRMKRLYTVAFYREMLQRCREKVPGVAISSDFIVGFSGETEESFQRTCDLVRDASGVRLAKRHDALSIRRLRDSGWTPDDVVCAAGLPQPQPGRY